MIYNAILYIFHFNNFWREYSLIYEILCLFSCPRHLRMKLNKENLHGARYIGKWLSLLLRFELCGHVWLVFFCIVFKFWSWCGKATQNVAQIWNKRKNICLYWHWITSTSWLVNLLTLKHHWSKSGPTGLSNSITIVSFARMHCWRSSDHFTSENFEVIPLLFVGIFVKFLWRSPWSYWLYIVGTMNKKLNFEVFLTSLCCINLFWDYIVKQSFNCI